MNNNRQRSVIVLLTVLTVLSMAGPVEAVVKMSARVDRESINLDDSLRLQVILDYDQQNVRTGQVQFPETRDFELEGTQYQEQMSIVNGAVSIRRTTVFTVMPSRAGQLVIPPLQNWYIDPATGRKINLETPPIPVEVRELPKETSKQDASTTPVEPVVRPRDPFRFTLMIIGGTTAAILLFTILFAWFYRHRDSAAPDRATFDLKLEKRPEAEQLRQDTARRKDEGEHIRLSRERLHLLARDNERSFARELARLLRVLLEEASGQSFCDKTADEIRGQLEYLRLGGEARSLGEDILEYCDAVNYSGESRSFEEREDLVEKLRRLKQLTA